MPPRKGLNAVATPSKAGKGGRRRKQDEDGVPLIFREMLAEEAMSSVREELTTARPVKRRRTSPEPSTATLQAPSPESQVSTELPRSSPAPSLSSERPQQVIWEDSRSSEDGSDVEFEDVTLKKDVSTEAIAPFVNNTLQLDLSEKAARRSPAQRRKPVSRTELDHRINVHKTHLLLLLLNIQLRRRWCESEDVQAILKPLIPSKLRNMLHVSHEKPDYQRSLSFMKAIEEICPIWQNEFDITRAGMQRAFWREDVDALHDADEFDDPSNFEEFRTAAEARRGSRDLGAILFCALLRSAAVETRIVCSLQVLPVTAAAKSQAGKHKSDDTYEYGSNAKSQESDNAIVIAPVLPSQKFRKKLCESGWPIFWVEVMLPTTGAWIPVDPLVRRTINKPKTGFEPHLNNHYNSMSYVIAFEDTGFAKDVTRRYTQSFNGKTRKQRIENTHHGDYWWSATMQWFRRFKPIKSVSDVLEDRELNKRSEHEPMPKNISDFKGHPVFALERHLRRNEAIWPDKHRGFVSAGNKDGKSEKVFHRKNVHIVRSAGQWYRRGRDLKIGEQPLKRVATQKRRSSLDEDEDNDENEDTTPLYAEFQTQLYVPPPVVKGRIPKNQYGNIDTYVPTMIPPGAIHVQHSEAWNAAKVLSIDFADAVTGFKFKGRHGTAVINGIVAAAEFRDAIVEVVEALEYERIREQEQQQSVIALSMWKRFVTALLIKQRIKDEHAEHDDQISDVEDGEVSSAGSEEEDSPYIAGDDAVGGGFLPDTDEVGDIGSIDAGDLAKLKLDPRKAIYQEVFIVDSPHVIRQQLNAMVAQKMLEPEAALQSKTTHFGDNGGHDNTANDLFDSGSNGASGGFVREHDENVAGSGFMGEDDASIAGGGFVPDLDEDVAEGCAIADQISKGPGILAIKPHVDLKHRSEKKSVVGTPSLQDEDDLPTIHEQSAATKDPETSTGEVDRVERDDEVASLLSHDPEDDDVEDAWLLDIDD